jgi:hypothetical protein
MNRYLIVQEPTCTWAVFDTLVDIPATVDGEVAIGLSLSEAIIVAAKANAGRSGRVVAGQVPKKTPSGGGGLGSSRRG